MVGANVEPFGAEVPGPTQTCSGLAFLFPRAARGRSASCAGDRVRLQTTNEDSLVIDAPMTPFYGTKVGTDTHHHERAYPETLRLHECPALKSERRRP